MAQNISKKLSFIGENIKKIRQARRISQAEFAHLFNLARPSIGAYEEGRSEPKIDTIIQMAQFFSISIDVLLTRKLTVSEIYSVNLLNQKLDKAHQLDHEHQAAPHQLKKGIGLVKVSQYLDYIVSHNASDFIQGLQKIDLPVENIQNFRSFEMNGSEMEYHQQGLHHGDILLCSNLAINQLGALKEKTVLIVHKETITTRRLAEVTDSTITLKSDDPNYPITTIKKDDLIEAWLVEAAFSKYLNPPSILEERVLRLEKIIEDMRL